MDIGTVAHYSAIASIKAALCLWPVKRTQALYRHYVLRLYKVTLVSHYGDMWRSISYPIMIGYQDWRSWVGWYPIMIGNQEWRRCTRWYPIMIGYQQWRWCTRWHPIMIG